MSGDLYAVVFTGKLVEGVQTEVAQARLAKLFKVEPAKVAHFFSGKKVAIKKNLDAATAKKYQQVFHKAGMVCGLLNQTAAAAKKAAPQAQAKQQPAQTQKKPQSSQTKSDTKTPPTKPAVKHVERLPEAANGPANRSVVMEAPADLGDLSAVEAETQWDQLEPEHHYEPPEVDLSGVDLEKPNPFAEVEEEEFVPLEVDTSNLHMDEVGVLLIEPEEVEELDVDISELDMDAPGVILVEPEEVEEPDIDISHLSAEKPPVHF